MLAQEGERWIVTLAGYFGDYPPTDELGFLEFARSLPVPDVYEVIRMATPPSVLYPRIALRVLWGNLPLARANESAENKPTPVLTHG